MDKHKSTTKLSPPQEKKSQSIDWVSIAEPVALRLLGEPNHKYCNKDSLRWGNKGSKKLDLRTGCWKDFESGHGGGVLELIKSELGYDKTQALAWLRDQGLIGDNRSRSPVHSLNRTTPDHYHPSANKLLTANTESSAEQNQNYARELWSESLCIPVDPQHPARRWLARRNLWHSRITPPVGLRYLENHKDGPSLIVLVALLSDWIKAFPAIPAPSGIQRILIDDEGRKRFSEGIDKYSLGTIQENVFSIGNTDAKHVTVCEGVADCLALASRLEGLHICTLGTSGMKVDTFTPLERIPDRKVSICCDNDSAGKEQAEKLRAALIEKGIPALIEIPPPPNKDFAALAKTEPWTELGFENFKERALSLEKEGLTKQEAERLALIHAIDRKDAMNSFEKIRQNGENMSEETINEAKQKQEHREQQDQEKADALKFFKDNAEKIDKQELDKSESEQARNAYLKLGGNLDGSVLEETAFSKLVESLHGESDEKKKVELLQKMKTHIEFCQSFQTISIQEHKPQPRFWIIENWLPAGRVGLFTGKGGIGKSRIALQIALAVCKKDQSIFCRKQKNQNQKILNLIEVTTHGNVVYASWEDELDEIVRRLRSLSKTLHSENESLAKLKHDLIPYDLSAAGPLWAPISGSGHIATMASLTETGKQLRLQCERKNACLLIIDPLAAAYASEENNRGLVRNFMSNWDAWGRKTKCSILFIAHPSKQEEGSAGYSGSTDWLAASRFYWSLGEENEVKNQDGNKQAQKKPLIFKCNKSSYAMLPEPCYLKFTENAWLAVPKPEDEPSGKGKNGKAEKKNSSKEITPECITMPDTFDNDINVD